ncbi:MAG: hypothetical protein K6G86_07780 [Bacteroidales bacterium]|nr:hypothetical protein [Bacteroidales bacterium]
MQKRYSGEFVSVSGTVWRCEIFQESETAFASVGDLDFPTDPLTLEWGETGKEGVMCGSVATLKIISPGDRSYLDLYSEAPGQLRLDVYRANVLYWSGCLDPEFYEEPYDRGSDYDVSLTFSDFGILSRLKYNLAGLQTLSAILSDALTRSKISYGSVDTSLISTTFADGSALSLSEIQVQSSNFFDEDDEAADLYSAVEAILRPLSLRIIQRAGKIWIYDLNAVANAAVSAALSFNATGQKIGVDKVYNNIKITLSAYNESTLFGDMKYTGEHSASLVNRTNDVLDPERYTYYCNYADGHIGTQWDYLWFGFTIFISATEGEGLASINGSCRYFCVQPLLDGSEVAGVAYFFYTGGHGSLASGYPKRRGAANLLSSNAVLLTSRRHYLPALTSDARENVRVRILESLLLDPRYNPFEESGDGNEKANYEEFESKAGLVRIPVSIQLYDASGTVLYHYENKTIDPNNEGIATKYNTEGAWVAGAASYNDAYLSWYDPEDFAQKPGVLGWKANRQTVRIANDLLVIYPSLRDQPDGQFIPYPPVGGYIEIKVHAGAAIYHGLSDVTSTLLAITRWFLLGSPEVSVVNNDSVYSEVPTEDVEYEGVVNEHAKESLEISETCGTMEIPAPGARGLLLDENGSPIISLSRAGRTTQAEQLMIGTLYSQFAGRKTKLSGSVDLLAGGVQPYSEPAQPSGTKFIVLQDVQDVREETSDIVAVEVVPDSYSADNE